MIFSAPDAGASPTQHVLVLGANGLIGRRIVAQLSRDDAVTVTAAGRSPVLTEPAENIRTQAFDATDENAMLRALTGITGVVNCIAGHPDTIISSARTLFTAAAQIRPAPRIVHLSSLAAYGSINGTVDESVLPRGDLGPYSAARLLTEKLAGDYESAVTLRPGIVYGPQSPWWSDRIARLLCSRRLGDLGKAGDGLCNLVYVDDVANAAARALHIPGIEGRIFNLGIPSVPSWNDYFSQYAKVLGALPLRRISRIRLAMERNFFAPPLKLLELVDRLGISPPPPIRPWLLEHCRHRIGMVVTRAEKALGIQWTALDEGLKVTADWFLAGARY
jgi:2-alkyl-3-oxoalkanoate reductase